MRLFTRSVSNQHNFYTIKNTNSFPTIIGRHPSEHNVIKLKLPTLSDFPFFSNCRHLEMYCPVDPASRQLRQKPVFLFYDDLSARIATNATYHQEREASTVNKQHAPEERPTEKTPHSPPKNAPF